MPRRRKTPQSIPIRFYVDTSPDALRDVDTIFEFIARTHPLNAARYVDRIVEAIAGLELIPNAWPRLPMPKRSVIRYRVVGSHRILFRVSTEPAAVRILRIMDARSPVASAVRAALRAGD